MRVAFIAGYTHPVYHRKIELLADASDVELLHVTVTGYGRETGEYPSANGQRRYRVQTFGAHYLGRHGDPHRGFLWPPHYALPGFRPDIVQAESDLEALGTAQVSLAQQLSAPHSKLLHYTWQNILRPRSWPVRVVTSLSLHAADHIICASAEAAQIVRQQGYRRGTTIMPLVGLDTRYFYARPVPDLRARLNLTGLVIGYVGRVVREKGLEVLLDAVAAMTHPAQVLIVGDGEARSDVEKHAQSIGLGQRVCCVDHVAYDDVAAYLNAIDILVLPSRSTPHWKEQFGRVLVEAMGCKVAVIGSDSGAIPEVVGDPQWIFPEGQAAALAMLLDRLAANPIELAAARERGYQHALRTYAVERLVERTLALWRELVS